MIALIFQWLSIVYRGSESDRLNIKRWLGIAFVLIFISLRGLAVVLLLIFCPGIYKRVGFVCFSFLYLFFLSQKFLFRCQEIFFAYVGVCNTYVGSRLRWVHWVHSYAVIMAVVTVLISFYQYCRHFFTFTLCSILCAHIQ
jgi:hypothetical protein